MTTATTDVIERPASDSQDLPVIRWLSAPEAAAYLGVHVNHLRTISPTRLPYYNIAGRLRRYRLEDIDAFIESSRIDTDPGEGAVEAEA